MPLNRLIRVFAYGITMMGGTLAVLYYGMHSGGQTRAVTLACTTSVLFQFFNVFNARSEAGSAFNHHLFDNRMLWLSLAAILGLQFVAVEWAPAAALFGATSLSWPDWGIAIGVASLILWFEETRKLGLKMLVLTRRTA